MVRNAIIFGICETIYFRESLDMIEKEQRKVEKQWRTSDLQRRDTDYSVPSSLEWDMCIDMEKYPKILQVETGFVPNYTQTIPSVTISILDYQVYKNVPALWRKIEEFLRLDIYLAWRAKLMEDQYDIIFACSEKVGIPLTFLMLQKPMVVVTHYLENPLRARLVKLTGIARKWSGVGYISDQSKDFLINDFGISEDRLFLYETAKYLDKAIPCNLRSDGPIMSIGVAKRDYNTLIAALSDLPEYDTELFVSSKFGDELKENIDIAIPTWVNFPGFISDDELIRRYQNTRFVIIPLNDTTHKSAGINIVLEAGAFGKAVIATNTGGMADYIKNGETGLLVAPNDVGEMRNAIRKLWTNPDLARRMGLANRCFVEKKYNPKDVDTRISELLHRIHEENSPKT